jgi:hypothetical protein
MKGRYYPKRGDKFYAILIEYGKVHCACQDKPFTCIGHQYTVSGRGVKYCKVVEGEAANGSKYELDRSIFSFLEM